MTGLSTFIMASLLLTCLSCESIADLDPRVTHAVFDTEQTLTGTGLRPVSYLWKYGDRTLPLNGVMLSEAGSRLQLALPSGTGKKMTLELREFRTADGQSPAYLVAVNGKDVAFRCRRYDEAGPSSAFIDLPDASPETNIQIEIENKSDSPLCLSEVYLYQDLEGWVRERGLWMPMYIGPTVRNGVTPERLKEIKAMLPDDENVKPMYLEATLAIAAHSPESIAEQIQETIRLCKESGMPIELHLNTWWAGTPSGFDGAGGRWFDPEYQQINYQPSGKYSLPVPNRWSCVPWLTTRHPRFNAFKADRFREVGQIFREAWGKFGPDAATSFPILSLVMDNEVTYWGAGMPGTPFGIIADVNPSMVEAARREGVTLDPTDGLSDEEVQFLRHSLTVYNREMAEGFLKGLGNCPLREKVYTHTWAGGSCYENPAQAFEAGVLKDIHLGTEWNFKQSEELQYMDVAREFGIPASINVELGGRQDADGSTPFSFATGCHHVSLFNAGDELINNTISAYKEGWKPYYPVPYRKSVIALDFEDDTKWRKFLTDDEVEVQCISSKNGHLLKGKNLEQSNKTMLHLVAKDLLGQKEFERLSISYKARAFVHLQQTDEAYLAVSVGSAPDKLREVQRITNSVGQFQVDLTPFVKDATDAFVEFEFHPLGLAGWVGIFDLSVEVPWEQENLLQCNRDYSPSRLRAESLIVGWRAEAFWAIQRCEGKRISKKRMAEVKALYDEFKYRQAYERAVELLEKASKDTYLSWTPPQKNRVERGAVNRVSAKEIFIDSYKGGFRGRKITLAKDAQIKLSVNGNESILESLDAAESGDDVKVVVRNNEAVKVALARGEATGKVLTASPATAFQLPTLQIEGVKLLPIDSCSSIIDRTGEHQPGACPLVTDKVLFEPGDVVSIKWNPYTKRITKAHFVAE